MTNPIGQPAGERQPAEPPEGAPVAPEGATDGRDLAAELEAAQEQIKALRREAAGYRVKARDAKSQLDEFEKWKRSQMSDAERMQAELTDQRKALLDEHRQVLAARYNVPEPRVPYISGGTADEMRASAEALGDKPAAGAAPPVAPGGPNLHPGQRGAPVGSGAKPDANAQLRAVLRGGRG